ncbi:hypothetical protein RchiOBHm_Chr6g0253381 [Rosa chinensis]|uniref:Uncharacterized protein n=1 Tax=Rosa chinensis TaxID=74649 RepID=A0A2P6PLE6_ROSCH|nr:hypothetical protein RchiOBHm_Chr6g0253381 [Rosa chinensis]
MQTYCLGRSFHGRHLCQVRDQSISRGGDLFLDGIDSLINLCPVALFCG